MEYAAAAWDPSSKNLIQTIEQVQRRHARYVTNNYWEKTPGCVTRMLDQLQWVCLERRRQNIRLAMMYRIVHGQVDINKELYMRTADNRTRGQTRYYQERINNNDLLNSFFPRTTRDWNRLRIYQWRLPQQGHWAHSDNVCQDVFSRTSQS
jgi:hypothetical protein